MQMFKMLLSLFLLLGVTNLFADTLEWGDLDLYERYTLNQDIKFDGVQTFKAGDSFDMQDRIGGGIPVIYFQMHAVDCADPSKTSEQILVDVDQKSDSHVIAAQLEEGCNIGLWVEVKDYYKNSVFNEFKE